jgi:inosine/xanthosine triphosphatase
LEILNRAPPGKIVHKIIVAVGSTRHPKLNAVREALTAFGPMLDSKAQFEVLGVDVPSGVSHTPASREELMMGARLRAEALLKLSRQRGEPWKYFIGLEGGLDVVEEDGKQVVFLQSWAYVTDGNGAGAYGQSGAVQLPEMLAAEVLDRGTELSVAIDVYAGAKGIRDAQGAFGVLTRNLITRQEAFRVAVVSAFAPFFNANLYPGRQPAK